MSGDMPIMLLEPAIEAAVQEAFVAYPELAMTLLRTAMGYASVGWADPRPDWWTASHGLAVELPERRRVESYIDPWTKRDLGPIDLTRIVTFYVRLRARGDAQIVVDCFEGPAMGGALDGMPMTLMPKPEGAPFVGVRGQP